MHLVGGIDVLLMNEQNFTPSQWGNINVTTEKAADWNISGGIHTSQTYHRGGKTTKLLPFISFPVVYRKQRRAAPLQSLSPAKFKRSGLFLYLGSFNTQSSPNPVITHV